MGAAVTVLRRLAARMFSAVLRSRVHPLVSGTLLLLTYRGRVTGRRITIPLLYARDEDDLLLVALHPEGQKWWRNLRGGADVEVLVAGRAHEAWAEVVGADLAARAAFERVRPWTATLLRRTRNALFVRVAVPPPADDER